MLNLLLAVVAVVVKLEMLLHVKEFKFLKAIKGKMETGAALAFGVMPVLHNTYRDFRPHL